MFLTVSLRPGQEQFEDWQPTEPTGIALLECSRLHTTNRHGKHTNRAHI